MTCPDVTGAPVSGPRFDHTGTLMAHSILGKPEDYIKQCDSEVTAILTILY